jgi:quercetin dioxygenase-like cupin family protein
MKPFRLNPKIVEKGWGHETHIANFLSEGDFFDEIREKGYCLKLLVFKGQNEGSMHFHSLKHETFYVLQGNFKVIFIHPGTAEPYEEILKTGEAIVIPQNNPHRIICLDKGIIIEASTPDRPEDSFRVAKGDSQREIIPKLKAKKMRKKKVSIAETVIREEPLDKIPNNT